MSIEVSSFVLILATAWTSTPTAPSVDQMMADYAESDVRTISSAGPR